MAKGKSKKKPERMCVNCKQMFAKNHLFRVVKVDEKIVLDPSGKLAGRGAYLCKNKDCISQAIAQKKLKHHLKTDIDADLEAVLLEALAIEEKALAKKKHIRIDKNGQKILLGDE